jgi:hypothetical protein
MATTSPVSAVRSAPPPGIWMPTKEQLTKIYKNMVDSSMKNHTAKKLAHAPVKNPDKYPSYTYFQGVDASRKMYVIKGQLYLRDASAVPTFSSWYKIGPVPMF